MTTENTDTPLKADCNPRLVLHLVPGKIYDTGKYKWMHGRPTEWAANRAVLRELLGPCPECGRCTTNYGCSYSCVDPYCRNSANQFVTAPIDKTPDWWQTQVNVFLDGNAWCATLDGFVNLQESVAGFGDTPRAAVANLLENAKVDASPPLTPKTMLNDKSPSKSETAAQQETGGGCVSRLVLCLHCVHWGGDVSAESLAEYPLRSPNEEWRDGVCDKLKRELDIDIA